MWRSVQLSIHTSIRFHDDGRTDIVRTECSGHEIEGFKIILTDEERDNLPAALIEGQIYWKPSLPPNWGIEAVP